MEKQILLKIEKLEENGEVYYLATSDDVQGLVVDGTSLDEVLNLAQELAPILLEVKAERAKQETPISSPNIIERSLVVHFNG